MTMQRCNTTYIIKSLVLLCTQLAMQSFWSSSQTKFPFNNIYIYNWAQLGYSRASLSRSLKLKLGPACGYCTKTQRMMLLFFFFFFVFCSWDPKSGGVRYIGFCWDKKRISYFFFSFSLLLTFIGQISLKRRNSKTLKFRKLSKFEGFQIATRCKKKGNQKLKIKKIVKVARFLYFGFTLWVSVCSQNILKKGLLKLFISYLVFYARFG
jgi:hypothetical protein